MEQIQPNIIEGLISLKQEGGYWDFKREWHKNNNDLLHDIICMANNLINRDTYIIIGVDENADCSVCDVSSDPNRKTTQNITDFLKDKRFAGDFRPMVKVETLSISDTTLDIIVIENSNMTPFFYLPITKVFMRITFIHRFKIQIRRSTLQLITII